MSTWEEGLRKFVDLAMSCDERRPRMTPELEALHARALLEERRRRILRDGFKASIEQLAVSTRCREEKILMTTNAAETDEEDQDHDR